MNKLKNERKKMRIDQMKRFTLLGLACMLSAVSLANVKLPQIIGSNMVLQQGSEIRIWGWADKKETVSVSFNDQARKTRADKNGDWLVVFDAMDYGGPFDMSIKGKNTLSLTNIMIGEVWICSGQSNMEMALNNTNNAEKEIADANYPQIRLFKVPRNLRAYPVEEIPEEDWVECSPATAGAFSAVGYFFGRELHTDLDVAIGLIGTYWGGSMAEGWMSRETLETIDGYKEILTDSLFAARDQFHPELRPRYDSLLLSFGETKGGLIDGKAIWANPLLDDSKWKEIYLPQALSDEGYIGLSGAVWYRKELVLPNDFVSEEATLNLEGSSSDLTWVNGIMVGSEAGVNKPRKYKVDQGILQPGKNIITVLIDNWAGDCGMPGDPGQLNLLLAEKQIPLAGSWKFRLTPLSFSVNPFLIHPNALPTSLYNGMLYPISQYGVKGTIWYQGESNAGRAYQYRELFPRMIQEWRDKLDNPDMPFLFVQLANFTAPVEIPGESDWAELREAQTMTLEAPNTGMAVIIDIGEADDIHPKNKKEVGYRLSLDARHSVYGENIVYSGPMYESMEIEGDKIKVRFDHTGSGLMAGGKFPYLMEFTIAGEDRVFHRAKAGIEGISIVVSSDKVTNPVAVRYAWANNPENANLYNKEGLPASPFRTDQWEGLTIGKKLQL